MNENLLRPVLDAKWTNDCQGKKDYDGDILSISTRYWPGGGGFWLLTHGENGATLDTDPTPDVLPSAHSVLVLHNGGDDKSIHLADKHFEAETFEEVAAQVEAWAQEQMDKAVTALLAVFPEAKEGW